MHTRSREESAPDVNWGHAIYQLGKLGDVILVLVIGEGDARSRLRQAIPRLRTLVPGMLPEGDVRFRIERALAALRRFHDPADYARRSPSSLETEFDVTLSRIRNSTASKITLDLYSAYGSLQDMVDQHFMDSQIDAEAAGEVGPAFVVDSAAV